MIWRSNQFAAKIVFGIERWAFKRLEMGVQTPRNGRSDVEVSGTKVLLAERSTFKCQETGRLNVGSTVSKRC